MTYRTIAAGLAAGLVLVACSVADDGPDETDPEVAGQVGIIEVTDEDVYSEQCGAAVERAAAIGDMEDSVEDLDPAIVACDDLNELRNATDDHPTALDGVDVATFVANRCMYSEEEAVTSARVCAELRS